MPGPVPTATLGDILQVNFLTYQRGQEGVTTSHWRVENFTGLNPTLEELVTAADGDLSTQFKMMPNATCIYAATTLRRINTIPVSVLYFERGNTGVCTGGAHPLPQQVSGLVSFYSNVAGGTGRGRQYIPFPAVTDVDNVAPERPTAIYVGNLNGWAGLMIGPRTWGYNGGLDTCTVAGVIWSRKANTFRYMTVGLARTIWATQRRRGDYGRPNPVP
jgi:hypothetical protein